MLSELTIKNFAIIDEVKISFSSGLNIITGETGAGKSIIVGAVAMLLGDRASADIIRTGAESAQVEAVFNIEGRSNLKELLTAWGINEEGEIIVRRIISRSGKSRAYINGQAVTTQMLTRLGEELLNICGQHEHQLLLKEDNHLDILDAFAGISGYVSQYENLFAEMEDLREKINHLEAAKKRREEMRELVAFQLREIEEADPRPGEDEKLLEERQVLINAERLRDLAMQAFDCLYSGEGSALEKIKRAINALQEIKKIDSQFGASEKDLQSIYYELEDTAFLLRNYGQSLHFDEGRREEIEERLERLNRLKKKYGGSIEEVLTQKEELREELNRGENIERELEGLKGEWKEKREELEAKAQEISQWRREYARRMEEALNKEFDTLMMEGARFFVHFEETELYRKGKETASFFFTANPGEAPKPLHKVASGGELSRLMLALKKVLADKGFSGTIVFDEVDSGIGGATAEVVGEKIEEVAKYNQVICITHLPQIARFAHRHYRVEKKVVAGKTKTAVGLLDEKERKAELARMLGGKEISPTTLKHAAELLSLKDTKGRDGVYAEEGKG